LVDPGHGVAIDERHVPGMSTVPWPRRLCVEVRVARALIIVTWRRVWRRRTNRSERHRERVDAAPARPAVKRRARRGSDPLPVSRPPR